jgi:hypothetical protein
VLGKSSCVVLMFAIVARFQQRLLGVRLAGPTIYSVLCQRLVFSGISAIELQGAAKERANFYSAPVCPREKRQILHFLPCCPFIVQRIVCVPCALREVVFRFSISCRFLVSARLRAAGYGLWLMAYGLWLWLQV